MDALIAACGLDCARCDAYQATRANDTAWKVRIVEKWRVDYHSPDMPVEAATCVGCTAEGQHGGYCQYCGVRQCAGERGMQTCAHCPDYGCETLQGFLQQAPELKESLDMLRARLA